MKIKAKYLNNKTKAPVPFEDPDYANGSAQFVKDKTYEFEVKGMTLYPQKGNVVVRYTSLAHFLRNWTDVEVLSDDPA